MFINIFFKVKKDNESLLPLLKGDTINWTRDVVYYHYYEYPGFHMVKRHYGIVTKDYKLVHFYHDIDEWELYDRKKDMFELHNVYNNQSYAELVPILHQQLEDLREKYGDSKEKDQKFIELYKKK